MSVFKRNDVWVVKFKNAAGKWQQLRTKSATKAEARLYLQKLEHRAEQQRNGLVPMERPTAMSLGELVAWHDKYFPATLENSDTLLAKRHLVPVLEKLPLIELTAARIDEVLSAKEDDLAPKTLNNLRTWVQGVFNRAIHREVWNGSNPATAVPRRKVPKRVPSYLKPDEVRSLPAWWDLELSRRFSAS